MNSFDLPVYTSTNRGVNTNNYVVIL